MHAYVNLNANLNLCMFILHYLGSGGRGVLARVFSGRIGDGGGGGGPGGRAGLCRCACGGGDDEGGGRHEGDGGVVEEDSHFAVGVLPVAKSIFHLGDLCSQKKRKKCLHE